MPKHDSQIELERRADSLVNQPVSLWRKLDRWVQVARYYRWKQIALRAKNVIKNKLVGNRSVGAIADCGNSKLLEHPPICELAKTIIGSHNNHVSHVQNDVISGKLFLLNELHNVGWPLQWDITEASHLWRFQLHYHEFLLEFISREFDCGQNWSIGWEVILDWVKSHPPERSSRNLDAWHPYCISRRLPVWTWLLLANSDSLEQSNKELILKSYSQQVVWLSRNLEKDLGGNHLFENYTALAIAGSVIDSPHSERWLNIAEQGIEAELIYQTLPHGEHFERSPMYHCQILGNLLKIRILTKSVRPSLSQTCHDYSLRMLKFINSICHSDGEIPLFGDSCFYEAPSMDCLSELAILAEVENDELPAHGHCDLLGFEASVSGRRWIVDSGNFFYESGSMRQYCRSSLAHNSLTVNSSNQCDIYSKFRMGKRGRIVKMESGAINSFEWASGAHDGYRVDGIPTIERCIAIGPNNTWVCCDLGIGSSEKSLFGFLHFGVGLVIKPFDGEGTGLDFLIQDDQAKRRLTFFGTSQAKVLEGWYCPAFGCRQKNSVIEYQLNSTNSIGGWVLSEIDAQLSLDCSAKNLILKNSLDDSRFEWSFK